MEKLRASFSAAKLKKEIAISIGQGATQLHGALLFAITKRYNSPYNLNAAWINKSRSVASIGTSIIESTLLYQDNRVDLSKFPYTFAPGNINPANRKGYVHKVTVIRGRESIVYGKSHRGGFVPRRPYGVGTAVRFGRHGAQMFERKFSSRYPLRLLLGPSIGNMINRVIDIDSAVQGAIENIANTVATHLGES